MTDRPSMRAVLRCDTREAHDRLHADPVLSALTDPGITARDYRHALRVFQGFYGALEAQRRSLGVLLRFSLAEACTALASDLGEDLDPVPPVVFNCHVELLGALYVAHGAAFGRSGMVRNISTALPAMPRLFLSRPADPGTWRALLDTVEHIDTRGRQALLSGAKAAFASVGEFAAREQAIRMTEKHDAPSR